MVKFKRFFAVMFYLTFVFEILFNLLILTGYLFFSSGDNVMPAYKIIYAIILFVGVILSILFAVRDKWGKTFWSSFVMALMLIGCAINYPKSMTADFNDKFNFLLHYHLHILIPCIFAFIIWISEVLISRKQDKVYESSTAKKGML